MRSGRVVARDTFSMGIAIQRRHWCFTKFVLKALGNHRSGTSSENEAIGGAVFGPSDELPHDQALATFMVTISTPSQTMLLVLVW